MAEDTDERTIELTIEALTGTVYDLCVSPYETILGIKLKVQRLEGIPVYQQQLVWGGTELQDEFCLEEYSIPSGAQLKLLVAMRGGPIHAQRVHLDLEDPTLLEIAELLDSQAGDKYTLMLLRNGDDLDHASFVQVQMMEEEDAMRLSPIHVAEPQHVSVATNKATCTEHAITRDKMKELMTKFKREREFRQTPPHPLPNQTSAQLSRKGAGKVLFLESRASSRLRHNAPSRVTPLSSAHAKEARLLTQRKLVFPAGDHLHPPSGNLLPSGNLAGNLHSSGNLHPSALHPSGNPKKRLASCSLASRRGRSPDETTPIMTRNACSRVCEETDANLGVSDCSRVQRLDRNRDLLVGEGVHPSPPKRVTKTDLPWNKPSKRKRRTSSIDPSLTLMGDISRKLSQLDLNSASIDEHLASESRTADFLPPIVCPHPPTSSTNPKSLSQALPNLPTLSIATTKSLNPTRKKRCLKCGKKMGLASTYSCRCGGLFCALHRYAETHSCNFDYKAEGRQLIARSNPVVAAQKLPKI